MASPNVFFSFEGFNFESSDIFLFQKLYGLIDGLLIIVIYYQLQSHRGVDIRIAGKWTRPLSLAVYYAEIKWRLYIPQQASECDSLRTNLACTQIQRLKQL